MFLPHFDYGYQESKTRTTVQTVMFYLDESAKGADTVVYNELQEHYAPHEDENVLERVVPRTGMALVFNPKITHGGDPVRPGDEKHVLRTEVVY